MHSLVLAVASTLTLASAEPAAPAAPIPIDGPITISQSGDYIVMQDFTAAGVPAIQFADGASATVTIDFDGHKVVGSIIFRRSGELGTRTLTIKNGRFEGFISAVTGHGFGWSTISLDNMTHTSVGTNLEDGSFVAKHCRFVNAKIITDANFGSPLLQLEDSEVISGNVSGWGSRVRIIGNDIYDGSILLPCSDGWGPSGLVAGNVLHNGSIEIGSPGTCSSSRVQAVKNDVSGFINLSASDSLIQGNLIRGCGPNRTSLSVGLNGNPAFRGQIRANVFVGDCDHGIYLSAVTRDWYYSDNVFREYVPEPIVDEGEYNYSGHDVAPE